MFLKKKLSDLVIMSDVDGTLLYGGINMPERNIQAARRFVAKGGRFGIATGRSVNITRQVVERLPVNFPCVVFNGGGIYDFAREEYIYRNLINDAALGYVKSLWKAFPDCGAVLVDSENYLDMEDSAITNQSWWGKKYPDSVFISAKFSEIGKDTLFKAFFVLSEQRCRQMHDYVTKNKDKFQGVRFVLSEERMLEMLPEDSSKGNALQKLSEIFDVAQENIVAIGDYYNDLEMIKYAGLGVSIIDSPEDIKAAANLIVGPCAQGSVAELIEYLEEHYE